MSQIFFEILSRVQSFTISNWLYTDIKQLNPYYLSSNGYYLSKPLNLQCFICHHQISVPKQIDSNDFDLVIKQLKNHKENCIYHQNNQIQVQDQQNQDIPFTKEQIYLLIDQIIMKIKPKFQILNQIKIYPFLNREQIENSIKDDSFTFKFISQAYKLNWPQQIKITFFLMLFGWAIERDSDNNVQINCIFCGRSANLNKYFCLKSDQQSKNLNYPRQSQIFDVISQHRYFCFWVNKTFFLQNYGYSIMIQQIYDKINESKTLFSRRQPQQTKKIRVQVDKYLQSFQLKTSQQFQKIKSIFHQYQTMRKNLQNIQDKNNLFENSQKRMKQFINQDVGQEIKGQIKKIKLN